MKYSTYDYPKNTLNSDYEHAFAVLFKVVSARNVLGKYLELCFGAQKMFKGFQENYFGTENGNREGRMDAQARYILGI